MVGKESFDSKRKRKDLLDVPAEVVKKGLTIVSVDHVNQVIEHALARKVLYPKVFMLVRHLKIGSRSKIKPITLTKKSPKTGDSFRLKN